MDACKCARTAQDVMSTEPVCADAATTVRELAKLLDEHEISGVPVVDAQERIIGVVSRTDLIRRCTDPDFDLEPGYLFELIRADEDDQPGEGPMPESLVVVEDFMTADPITGRPDEPVESLAKKMTEARVHRVIIIDKERRPIGVVTSLDLLKLLAK